MFRPRVLVLLAMVVSSTVLIPLTGRMLPRLDNRDEFRLQTAHIEVNALPSWVPENLVEQVINGAGLPDELSMLDRDLTREIAEAFQLHPWVAEVVSVSKSVPASIKVELKYRRPVALVQVEQGMYAIDAEATLLPSKDFSVADTKRYPVIQDIVSTPQGPVGSAWGDVRLTGAARLAATLTTSTDSSATSYWKQFGLAAIRAPRRTAANITIDEVVYELITLGGSRIVWGRAPGTDHPGELSAKQKVGRLEKYLNDFESFDKPHGPYEIDIRHWQEISRRPLSADRSTANHRRR